MRNEAELPGQTEITSPLPVMDDLGRPQNFGWSKLLLQKYNHDLLRAPRRSIGECDRYVLLSPSHMVVFEVLDNGYLGYLHMSVVSLKDKKRSTQSFFTPFSLGCFNLPKDSDSGTFRFRQKKTLLDFVAMEKGTRIIKADIPKFGRHRSLRGEVVLTPPEDAESLITNMPWRGKGDAFLFSRRSPWYSAEGVIQFGHTEIVFTRGNAWGIFDWNRGVRPSSDLRFWAAGCGQVSGHQAAFNVGYNSADSTLGTENAFFIDGRLHKLDQVTFHVPQGHHVPWRFTSNDNRLEMTFTPNQERDESRQMFLYSLKRRQLYGSFTGKAVLDSGEIFEFSCLSGMAERCKSRL